MLVQRACDQLLARARFAGHHDRDIALRQPADGTKHILHRRGLAQHLTIAGGLRQLRRLALALLHGTLDQLHRLGQVKGLGQVFKCAALESRDGAVQIRVGGHDDDRQLRVVLMHLFQQLQAIAAWHADIADQHRRGQCLVAHAFKGFQYFLGMHKAARGQLLAGECLFQYESDRRVIIHYPDWFHCRYHPTLTVLHTVVLQQGMRSAP